jgi:hypothetical protein
MGRMKEMIVGSLDRPENVWVMALEGMERAEVNQWVQLVNGMPEEATGFTLRVRIIVSLVVDEIHNVFDGTDHSGHDMVSNWRDDWSFSSKRGSKKGGRSWTARTRSEARGGRGRYNSIG